MSEMVERVAEGMIAAFEAINWRDEGKENAFRTLARAAIEAMLPEIKELADAARADSPDKFNAVLLRIDATLPEREPIAPNDLLRRML